MKEYVYNGERFEIEDTDACAFKVSDKVNTVTITLNSGGPSVYRVSTVKGGWWWHTHTVEESVRQACQELAKARKAIPPEVACGDLHVFVENLPLPASV